MERRFALITGASGGIGSAIAKKLAKQGYSLYLHYNRNEQSVFNMMEELSNYNIELIPIKADLSQKEGYRKLCDNIFSVDTIILNSGSSVYGLITDMDEQLVEDMVQLHVTSPFLISKMLLPKLMNKKNASIVAITSIWGQTGASYEVLYSMVKGAQNAFVKSLSKELALTGIRVNGVAPGAISTSMMENFASEELEMIKADIPMGRLGFPQEVAETVSFLISEKASYITGQIIGVNGGWYT